MICSLIGTEPSAAGAWLQPEGGIFLSYSGQIGEEMHPLQGAAGPAIFQEFGVRENLTLGFDGYLGDGARSGQVLLFARVPLGDKDRPVAQAVQFSLGYRQADLDQPQSSGQAVTRATYSMGKGLDNGWANLDLQLGWAWTDQDWQAKAEGTRGWSITDRVQLMGQLRAEGGSADELRGSASAGVILRAREGTRLVAQIDQKFDTGADPTLRLSLWQEF